jgi:hypothetical protein
METTAEILFRLSDIFCVQKFKQKPWFFAFSSVNLIRKTKTFGVGGFPPSVLSRFKNQGDAWFSH